MPSDKPVVWASRIEERLGSPELGTQMTRTQDTLVALTSPSKRMTGSFSIRSDEGTSSHRWGLPARSLTSSNPTHRPTRMYWKGRRVNSVIAVVETYKHPPEESRIVVLDLRGLGLWPQSGLPSVKTASSLEM